MSSYPPSQQSAYPVTPYSPPPGNGLGVSGFIISLAGVIVCFGTICPIGLVLSLIGLRKEPRGFAIAGALIGLVGSILGALAVLWVAGGGFSNLFNFSAQTSNTMWTASNDIDNYYTQNSDTLPDQATGTSMVSMYTDEWGTPIQYRPTQSFNNDEYELISAGPDLTFGTSDDFIEPFWAIGMGGFSATPFNPLGEADVPDQQINTAFDKAAEKLNASFSPDVTLPTNAQGNAIISQQFDAWGTPMQYIATDNPPWYQIKSAGPDRQWQTGDEETRSFDFYPTGE